LRASADRYQLSRHISSSDRSDRLYGARRLGTHSMVLVATLSMEAALADWRTQSATSIFAALAIECVIAAIWLSLRHQFRDQKLLRQALAARIEAEAARARAVAEVRLAGERERAGLARRQQDMRFGAALENMSQALCLFDRANRLVVANRRLAGLFQLPEGATAPGTGLSALLDLARGASNLARSDLTLLARMTPRLAGKRRTAAMIWELSDGRALSIHMRPMEDEGWLATIEDITERRQAEARIAHMAHHDALTGLANRVLFHKRLGQAIARARRGDPCAVLCLDLDQFKAVNDTLGHPIGDALLRAVTHRLQCEVRETDTLARLSGDEFAIVQTGVDQPDDATALASRLIEVIAEPFHIDGNEIVIGTSIGIAIVPGDGMDPHELLKNADLALYRAKADGRGTHRCFAPEMDAAMRARRALEVDLRRALAQNEFEVFYQPVLRMESRTLIGFEALVRWRHPERGLLLPAEFVPFAEEVGLIVKLGDWVLRRACADAVTWPDHLKVAVNLCPMQFGNKRLVDDVAQALEQSGLPARRLELEITETVMIDDTEGSLATLHRLRNLGVAIAMDDFGTGYSSLSYLLQFPFDRVKIDRCFVTGLGERGNSEAIVSAVTSLCATLGMATTAEGVETEGQFDVLARSACTEVQGYLFGRAIEAASLPALWQSLDGEAGVKQLEHAG
jgi:diguanylate cyclase (GGDEF)-like protein